MAKVLFNGPLTKEHDWGNVNGNPASGKAVQEYIKREFANRFGYLKYIESDGKYHLFTDEEGYEAWKKGETVLHASFDAPKPASIRFVSGKTSPISNINILGQTGNTFYFNYLVYNNGSEQYQVEPVSIRITITRDGELIKTITDNPKIINAEDAINPDVGTNYTFTLDDYFTVEGSYQVTVVLTGTLSGATATQIFYYDIVNLQLQVVGYPTTVLPYDSTYFDVTYLLNGGGSSKKRLQIYVDGEPLYQSKLSGVSNRVDSDFEAGTTGIISLFTRKGNSSNSDFVTWPALGEVYGEPTYEYVNGELVETPNVFTNATLAGQPVFKPGMKHSIQFRAWIPRDEKMANIESYKIYSVTQYIEIAIADESAEEQVYILYNNSLAPGTLFSLNDRLTMSLQQYYQMSVGFTPVNSNPANTVSIDWELDNGTKSTVIQSAEYVSGSAEELTYRINDYGTFTLNAVNNDNVKLSIDITVEEFSTNGQKLEESQVNSLYYKYSAENRSNSERNGGYKVWKNTTASATADLYQADAIFNNFPETFTDRCGWNNDGLVLSDGATVTIPVDIFSNFNRDLGLTFEIDFETLNVLDDEAVIMDYSAPGESTFIKLTATEASTWAKTMPFSDPLKTNYKDSTRNKIAFAFNPTSNLGRDSAISIMPDVDYKDNRYYGALDNPNLIFIYVNGVLDRASRWGNGQQYSDTVVWSNPSAGFTIGDPTGKTSVKIYSIRIYGMALSPEEEFMNYLTDSGERKLSIFEKNNIYNSSNEISFELVRNLIPTLLLSADYSKINNENTEGKKNNYQYELQYFDPNEEQKYLGFYVRNGWISCQGTSSMAYPTKNLRPYFNKIVNGKTQPKDNTALSEGTGDITSIGVSLTPSFATEFWPYEVYGAENENNVSTWVDGNISVRYADGSSSKTFDVSFEEGNGPKLPYATNGKEMYQKAPKPAKLADKVMVNTTTNKALEVIKNSKGDSIVVEAGKTKEIKLEKMYFHEIGGDRPHDVAMALAKYYNEKLNVQLFVGNPEPSLNEDGEMVGTFVQQDGYSDSNTGKYYMDAYHTLVKPGFEVDTDAYDLYLKQLRYSGVKIFERISVSDSEGNFMYYVYTKAKKLDRTKEYYGLGAYWRQYDGYGDTNNSGWTDRWTLKADFAESSMTHNAGTGRLWGNAMKNVLIGGEAVCKTDAQDNVEKFASVTGFGKKGFDVRTSCDGKPVVLFVKQEQAFDISTGKAGYGPIKYGGIFNIMTDKSSTKLFGFETIKDEKNDVVFSAYSNEDGDDPHKGTHNRVQCYEFLQNGSSIATGLSVKFDDRETDVTSGKKIGDGRPLFVDFESRFPDSGQERHEDNPLFPDDAYGVETNDFESFWRWVNFCKDAISYTVDGKFNGYTMSQYKPITWAEAQERFNTDPEFKLILKYIALGNEHYIENGGGNGAEKDTWINPFTGEEEVPNLDLTKEDPGYTDTYYEFIENVNYSNVKKSVRTETIAESGWQHVYRGKVKCFDSHFRVDHTADDAEDREAEFGVWAYLKLNNGKLYYTNEYGEENQPYDAEWTGNQVSIDDYETINIGTETNPNIVDASSVTFMEYFSKTKYQHLAVYKVAAYYIYITRFAGVDQVIKNSMMTTENGEQWYFINYDNDTILGVRNDAVLAFNWDVNRDTFDYSKNNYAYAGARSVLWNNLEMDDDFMAIVKEIDRAMFAQELLSKQTVLEYFNEKQMGAWCERLYNKQEDVKYLSTFKQDFGQIRYLVFLQGNRSSHRTWWVNKRWDLYDSLWESGLYDKQYISFKSNILDARETNPGYVCTFTASSKYRFKAIRNTRLMDGGNVELGMNETYNLLTKVELAEGDPVYLRGAQKMNVLSFRNGPEQLVELIMVEQFEYKTEGGTVTRTSDWVAESGTTMLKLLIGNGTKDAAFKTFSGYDKITSIEDFDIRRCVNISPSVSTLSNLHRFRASGSGLTSFAPHRGAVLYEVSLPAGIGELTLDSVNFTYQSPDDYIVYQKGKTPVDDSLPYTEDAEGKFASGPYTEEKSRKYTSESKSIFDYEPTARLNSISFNNVKGLDTLTFIKDWLSVVSNPANKTTLLGIDWTLTADEFIAIYEQLGNPELGTKFSGTIHLINENGDSVVSYEDYKKLVDKFSTDVFNSASSLKFVAEEESIFISATGYEEKLLSESDRTYNSHFDADCICYEVVKGESIKLTATVFPDSEGYKMIPRYYANSSQVNATNMYSASTPREYSNANVNVTWSGNTMLLEIREDFNIDSIQPIFMIDMCAINSDTNAITRTMTDGNNPSRRHIFIKVVNKTYPQSQDMVMSVVTENPDGNKISGHTLTATSYEEKTIEFRYSSQTAKIRSFDIAAANASTNLTALSISDKVVLDDKKGVSFKVHPRQNETTTEYRLTVNIEFESMFSRTLAVDCTILCKTIRINKLVLFTQDGTTELDSVDFTFDHGEDRVYLIKPIAEDPAETPNIPIRRKECEGELDANTTITINEETNELEISIKKSVVSSSIHSYKEYTLVFEDQFGWSVAKPISVDINIQYPQKLILKRQDYMNDKYDDANFWADYTEDVDLILSNGQGTDNPGAANNIGDGNEAHKYLEFVILAQGSVNKDGNGYEFITEETTINVGDITFTSPDITNSDNDIKVTCSNVNDDRNKMIGYNNRIRLSINSLFTKDRTDSYQMIIPVTYTYNKDKDATLDTFTTQFTVNISHSYASSVSYKRLDTDKIYLVDATNGFYEICSTDVTEFNETSLDAVTTLMSRKINVVGIGEVVYVNNKKYPIFASVNEEYSFNTFSGLVAGENPEGYYTTKLTKATNRNDYDGYDNTLYMLNTWQRLPENSKFNTVVKNSNSKVYLPSWAELTSLTGRSGNKSHAIYDAILAKLNTPTGDGFRIETKLFELYDDGRITPGYRSADNKFERLQISQALECKYISSTIANSNGSNTILDGVRYTISNVEANPGIASGNNEQAIWEADPQQLHKWVRLFIHVS